MKKLLITFFFIYNIFGTQVFSVSNTQILSGAEQVDVIRHLNRICSDTFCAGDFNYDFNSITCSNHSCILYYIVSSHYAEFQDEKQTCSFIKVKEDVRKARLADSINDLFYSLTNDKCLYI
jgi:hypothetical protein